MHPTTLQKTMSPKTDGVIRTVRAITADSNGELPTRIMLLRCGMWSDSVKGSLTITNQDLQEYKLNFDNGVALVNKEVGLPIDFKHESWAEAAAWIKGLEIEGDALYANPVEYSDMGREAILGGRFKCISPSFYPAARGGWENPEDLTEVIGNVLVGAGLTNIPFFSGLDPVKASTADDGTGDTNVIYINANAEEQSMKLDEVRIKEATALTDEEKQFLADHKAELSGAEQAKFGLVEASNEPKGDGVSAEEHQLLADIRDGKLKTVQSSEPVIDAARVASLEATAKKYETEKAEAIVESHIKRGAIKADTKARWTSRLLDASGAAREELEKDLADLPTNEMISKELGEEGTEAVGTTREQIAKLAADRVAQAKADGKDLDFVTAQREVLAANPDLAEADRKSSNFNA